MKTKLLFNCVFLSPFCNYVHPLKDIYHLNEKKLNFNHKTLKNIYITFVIFFFIKLIDEDYVNGYV